MGEWELERRGDEPDSQVVAGKRPQQSLPLTRQLLKATGWTFPQKILKPAVGALKRCWVKKQSKWGQPHLQSSSCEIEVIARMPHTGRPFCMNVKLNTVNTEWSNHKSGTLSTSVTEVSRCCYSLETERRSSMSSILPWNIPLINPKCQLLFF